MEYRNLGHSGLKVSSLCLGTMTFGNADASSFMHQVGCDDATSHAILDRARERGVNFIDTADVYGQDGLSERIIGAWFDQGGGRRDDTVLATKFRFRMDDGPNGTGAARHRIVRCVEDSLRRLRTDRIDLYQIHMMDLDTPEEETLRAFDDLIRAGKVQYAGCSNYTAYRLVESLATAERRGLSRFISLQPQYSLVCRDIERELVPACQAWGVGIIPWSPLAGGFLSGKYHEGQAAPAGARLDKWKDRYGRFDTPRNWRIIAAVRQVAEQVGATPATVALAWTAQKPGVTSVIFGARTVAQLDDNCAAAELTLDEAAMKALDEASSFEVGYPYDFIQRVHGRW